MIQTGLPYHVGTLNFHFFYVTFFVIMDDHDVLNPHYGDNITEKKSWVL